MVSLANGFVRVQSHEPANTIVALQMWLRAATPEKMP
jgi:hypothetical protein